MTEITLRIQQSRTKLAKFDEAGKVPLYFAQRMVQECAYWYGHHNGPARAPGHHERVTGGPHGWEIEFGANKFLVEQAIRRSKAAVLDALNEAEARNTTIDCVALRDKLQKVVRGAVANHLDEEYPTLWATHEGHMLFGTQSIHAGDFVNAFLKISKAESLCK
jgi:hypothetical protein